MVKKNDNILSIILCILLLFVLILAVVLIKLEYQSSQENVLERDLKLLSNSNKIEEISSLNESNQEKDTRKINDEVKNDEQKNENNQVKDFKTEEKKEIITSQKEQSNNFEIPKTTMIEVESISLNVTKKEIYIGDTFQLLSNINPGNATNQDLIWISSNDLIAKVDNNGNIVGLKEGETIISVTSSNGKSANCLIKVKPKDNIQKKVVNINFQNGIEGKITKNGWASRVYPLSNNTLIAGYEKKGSNGIKINTRISLDNGSTWSNSLTSAELKGLDCANINFFENSGNIYMAYRATGKSRKGFYTSLHVNVSMDYGKTWKYHSKIIENTTSSNSVYRGVWEPFLGLINGELTVMYANDSKSSSWQNIESRTWNGTSWSNTKVISNGKNHSSRDGMPSWIKLSSGGYVLVIESSKYRNNNYPFVLQMLYSLDGNNWSEPIDIYIPETKNSKAAGPGIVELSNGELVITFQTDETSNKKGDNNSVMKYIYTKKLINNNYDLININKTSFTKSESVFDTPRGIWSGISYKNGWLYASAGAKDGALFNKVKIDL